MSEDIPDPPRHRASRNRVRFSDEQQDIEAIAALHADTAAALRVYYSEPQAAATARFSRYDADSLHAELQTRLSDLDAAMTLVLLTAVEAAFRVDYLQRCYQRRRDEVSKAFRAIFQEHGSHARLLDDILATWRTQVPALSAPLSELAGAFNYRHWLAHGRYWVPRLGRPYDFESTYDVADAVLAELDLLPS